MGSRPPRQHALPKAKPAHREPRAAVNRQPDEGGLKMESLAVFIGLAIFPVALGASGVAYFAREDIGDVLTAVVLTIVAGIAALLLARGRRAWRSSARMSNELVMAMLVGVIGATFILGGLASVSVVWIVIGAIVLVGAFVIGRSAKPTTT